MLFLYHIERKKERKEGSHDAEYIIQYLLPVKRNSSRLRMMLLL